MRAAEQFISAAGPMAMAGEISINVASLPDGKDPDEICREEGADAFHNLVAGAMPWLDWVIDFWAADLDLDNSAYVTEVENQLRRVIDGLHSNAVRAHYIDKVARVLSRTDKEATQVAKGWGERSVEIEKREWVPPTPQQTRVTTERRMLRIFVHKAHHRDQLRPLLASVTHPPLRWLCDRLEELEQHCATDLTPYSVMAVVAVAEPHFMQQLRTVVQPNVTIDDTDGVINHISDIMGRGIPVSHEPDSDQSSPF